MLNEAKLLRKTLEEYECCLVKMSESLSSVRLTLTFIDNRIFYIVIWIYREMLVAVGAILYRPKIIKTKDMESDI